MYADKNFGERVLKRKSELEEDSKHMCDGVSAIYTGKFYIVQTYNLSQEDIEFLWEVYDECNYIDTFINFEDVLEFLRRS